MSFTSPSLLWSLVLVPLATGAYVLSQRRRARYVVRFTNLDLLANLVPQSPRWRRHLPPSLYLLALTLLLVALARPHAMLWVTREQATVVLAMDSSGSMAATDVPPSRLAAEKRAVETFLEASPEDYRIAMISFDDAADVLVPPTSDRAALRHALSSIEAGGRTAIGDAIQRSLGIGLTDEQPAARGRSSPYLAVLLLSDGANTSGGVDPMDAADDARGRGVPVFTVALGTDDVIRMPDEDGEIRAFKAAPDEETLREIAEATDARFFSAPSQEDLLTIYEHLGSRLGRVRSERELTAVFAGAAAVLLLLAGAFSLRWFDRLP